MKDRLPHAHFITYLLVAGYCSCGIFQPSPLKQNEDFLDELTVHWFANEKIAYIFWSHRGKSARLSEATFDYRVTYTNQQGISSQRSKWITIDYQKAIFAHEGLKCGEDYCKSSFTFKIDKPPHSLALRFHYRAGAIVYQSETGVFVHQGETFSAYSVIPYGVYANQQNTRVQGRLYHNFGDPPHNRVAEYGLRKTWQFSIGAPHSPTTQEINLIQAKDPDPPSDEVPAPSKSPDTAKSDMNTEKEMGDIDFGKPIDTIIEDTLAGAAPADQKITLQDFLFPATFCAPATPTTTEPAVKGWQSILPPDKRIFPADDSAGRCGHATFFDQKGKIINAFPTYARKNPQAADLELAISIKPQDVDVIPLVLKHCDEPNHYDKDFFEYQHYIMGIKLGTGAGPCYDPSNEAAFRNDLETKIENLISVHTTKDDALFKVIMHHDLDKNEQVFQTIVLQTLTKFISATDPSPRFIGALVYDSTSDFKPSYQTKEHYFITWHSEDFHEDEIDLRVVQILTPSAAFSSRSAYQKSLKKWHRKNIGIITPRLITKSLFVDDLHHAVFLPDSSWASFVHHTRLDVQKNENIRFCPNAIGVERVLFWDDNDFLSPSKPPLNIAEFSLSLALNSDPHTYLVGLRWFRPWTLFLEYLQPTDIELQTPIYQIPINFETNAVSLPLGDDIWLQNRPIVLKMQKCTAFCNHPIFDEKGNYQIKKQWNVLYDQCPVSKYPIL